MREDLRKRLRELGVLRGVRQLGAPARAEVERIEDLVSGRFYTSTRGQCFVAEQHYPLGHLHGGMPLCSFLEMGEEGIVAAAQQPDLARIGAKRYCFLDTETTGLSGGTGTMAFVVGLGFFRSEGFLLHQYFLRDPGDEPAMIEALAEELSQFDVFVSFNGRAFDVPVLDARFVLDRRPPISSAFRHLDLLHPARRLWRYRLDSCALGMLERELLGVQREQADVPSGLIPFLYRDYLRTGDAREMKRVVYHNAIDILSLVTLAARLGTVFSNPWIVDGLAGSELLALARWYDGTGRKEEAERAYRSAIAAVGNEPRREQGVPAGGLEGADVRAASLRGLAYLLKRSERRAESFAYWQQLALEGGSQINDRLLAHVEVAKYLEWSEGNLALAAAWTEAAIEAVQALCTGAGREESLDRLRHRLARLQRKLGGQAGRESGAAAADATAEPQGAGDAGAA
jgi:uncharacterized protein YprB with RNaseH-like and TPR domain